MAEPGRMIEADVEDEEFYGEELDDDLEAPDEVLVNRRWVKPADVQWAKQANVILVEHGSVSGTRVYSSYTKARYRARRLIGLLRDLRIREPWEMTEHTNRVQGGYRWTVEYLRGGR